MPIAESLVNLGVSITLGYFMGLNGMVIGTLVGVAIHFVMNYILKKLDKFILNHRKLKAEAQNTNEDVNNQNN